MTATFYSLAQRALRAGATTVVDGRLHSTLDVGLVAVENPATTRTATLDYALFGPGDVRRLAPGAITRRFPTPGCSDAEETKLALVEFAAIDLPWRYTPQAAAGAVLRPWLELLVGVRSADGLVVRPDGRVGVGVLLQQSHPLAGSARWAHVHDVDGRQVARILSPVDLDPDTDYLACLVPAFDPDGGDAWAGTDPVVVDCYDRWSFRTGPQGDFPELAALLHKADLAAIDAADPEHPFGRAPLGYDRRGPGDPRRLTLSAAGALRLPPAVPPVPDPADQPPPADVVAETAALTTRILTPDGRGVVTAPRYDAGFATAADQAAVPAGGWIDQLRGDPRTRGAAGLGAATAIDWQDRIADAATAVLAGTAIAEDRIRHVVLGVEAARSLWRRRVPDPAVDPAGLLATLAPVLGRLPTTAGDTALDAVAGRTPDLTRSLFSSAARRALRPGPARTARAGVGAAGLAAAIVAANVCHPLPDDPADLPVGDVEPGAREEAAKAAIETACAGDGALAARFLDKLLRNGPPDPAELAAALVALTPGPDGRPDPDAVARWLNLYEFPAPTTVVSGWTDWLEQQVVRDPCRPVDLGALAGAVAGAVDPTVDPPPVVRRVLGTLTGVSGTGPVQTEPELDLPLWSWLSANQPDWMLPGVGDLAEGDVVGLATDPVFVEALLVGANTQTAGELRWRNVGMTTGWSPLRKFWQRAGGELDIAPVRGWPAGTPLGDPALTPGGHGSEAVVAFRTPLFRRYPATVVYLFPADAVWTPPGPADVLSDALRVDPTFTGTIGAAGSEDVTFFGFPVDPAALSDHWVVLEEPPTGYRFFAASAALGPDASAAGYAHNRFAPPVRVLIGPLL